MHSYSEKINHILTHSCIKKSDNVVSGSQIESRNMMKWQNIIFGFRLNGMNYYTEKSGTSMSTPMALLLSQFPEFMTRDVKMKFIESSDDLGQPMESRGEGG